MLTPEHRFLNIIEGDVIPTPRFVKLLKSANTTLDVLAHIPIIPGALTVCSLLDSVLNVKTFAKPDDDTLPQENQTLTVYEIPTDLSSELIPLIYKLGFVK